MQASKPNQRLVSARPQLAWQLTRGRQQLGNLPAAVEKGRVRLLGRAKKMPWRKLGGGIRHRQEFGQPPHGFQPSSPTVPVSALGATSPGNGQFGGQWLIRSKPVSVSGKIKQQIPFAAKPETQGPALGQIIPHTTDHAAAFHHLIRGQGSAACRSSSKWT